MDIVIPCTNTHKNKKKEKRKKPGLLLASNARSFYELSEELLYMFTPKTRGYEEEIIKKTDIRVK